MNVLAHLIHRLSTDAAFRRKLMERKDFSLCHLEKPLSPEDREVLQHVLNVLDQVSHEIDPDYWPRWGGYTDLRAVEHV